MEPYIYICMLSLYNIVGQYIPIMCVYRLINVDESQAHEVDVSAIFREWSLQQWRETTPDFLQSTTLPAPHSTTVQLSPLEMKSLVLNLHRNY